MGAARAWGLLLVGLMLGSARAAPAPSPPDGERLGAGPGEVLQVECVPAHAVLGTPGEVEVRVVVAPDATDVELFASAGQVGPPTAVSPGVYRAAYVPPRRNLPQEVILAARAHGPRGVLEGWTVLPLWGQGEAEVRTRPQAPVSVQVGGQRFGPIEADARGLARVPVTVPPGVEAAYFGARRIELGVPPWPWVHALGVHEGPRADRTESVEVRLYLSRLPGTPPRPPGPFTFSVPRGEVGEPVEREPGVFSVRWTVPPGPAGPLELRGGVEGEARWAFMARVEARPGPARHFELRVAPEGVEASEEAHVQVEGVARDAQGNPTRAELRLDSELSGPRALEEQRPGEYSARLALPARFAGHDTLELRLWAEGLAAPVATRRLTLRPAAPARVVLTPLRPVGVADGRTPVAWRVGVEDRFGNPTGDAPPEALLPGGGEGTWLTRGRGEYELRYMPAESRGKGVSEVEVRVGDVRERGTLPLLGRSVLTLAPRVGWMTNLSDVGAPSVGLRLEAWPVRAWPAVGVWLDVGYLRFSREGGTRVPGFSGDNGVLDTSLAVGLRTPREYAIQGWASVGGGLGGVRVRATWAEGREEEQGTWVPGVHATLGVGARAGPGQPFLELRGFRFNDPALPLLRGVFQGFGLHVGYRLELL